MKVYYYPVFLTMFASILPVVGQLSSLQSTIVFYLPTLIALVLVAAMPSAYRISQGELVFFCSLLIYVLICFFLGIGLGSGGTLIVLILSFVFKRFFAPILEAHETTFDRVVQAVLYIYKFNIVYVYAELLIVLAGYQDTLHRLLTTSNQLPGYKNYNHAHFLQALDLDVYGLGGVYLGSQAAGMMGVMSLVMFFQLRSHMEHGWRWMLLALGATLFCSNMTALVMFCVAIFLLVFVFHSELNSNRNRMLFVLLLPLSAPLITYKIENVSELNTYFEAFMPAVEIFFANFVEFRILELLFGYGSVGFDRYVAQGMKLGTDFGILALINQAGLLLFFICLSGLLIINFGARKTRRWVFMAGESKEKNRVAKYHQFFVTNVVILNILLVSLIHYTSAIEIGLRELFGLHAGLSTVFWAYCFNRRW